MTEAITRREGIKNGRPILEGSKLSVFQVYQLVCEEGLSPAAVVESYTGVEHVQQVQKAVSWAEAHPKEIETIRQQHINAVEELEDLADPI